MGCPEPGPSAQPFEAVVSCEPGPHPSERIIPLKNCCPGGSGPQKARIQISSYN